MHRPHEIRTTLFAQQCLKKGAHSDYTPDFFRLNRAQRPTAGVMKQVIRIS